ncbi:LRR receptor-like serine threonine-protein kinase [Musa troglodytarum]|uniref:non-specific serine/threonine protein kinase n=2 Tax=Musa troglodytarum TaxID=320322 RepID=A0A9E7HMU1_9LILI|nr:LRR receptor-like serine threonine-protein kinase [Musa troglodytarum]
MRRELTWKAIMEATCNLSHEFAIGSGGSGIVYRAELPTGETVTVKKILHNNRENLMLQENSFVREVKTLGRIRHRHLANLLGCLSSNHGEHLLIYEYMENGSLWDWLHKPEKSQKRNRELSWEARLRIAIGLAKGVEYLHHDCVPSILHRDIKSGNVLLDGDMEAHLGDFGLAKAAAESRGRDSTGNTESGTCFAGSYGYVAPATEKGDVYSMGIVLMELVSGLMPTDRTFEGDMDMVRWVRSRMTSAAAAEREASLDPVLKPLERHEESSMFEVLDVALQCTRTAPAERPSSRKVADLLLHISLRIASDELWKESRTI